MTDLMDNYPPDFRFVDAPIDEDDDDKYVQAYCERCKTDTEHWVGLFLRFCQVCGNKDYRDD